MTIIKKIFLFSLTIVMFSGFGSIITNAQGEGIVPLEVEEPTEPEMSAQKFSGSEIVITEEIWGDVFATAGKLDIDARIRENLFFMGSELNINQKAKGSVFILGENIRINADTGNDVFAVVSSIQIDGDVDQDLYITADKVLIKGLIGDDINIVANEVYFDGRLIKGDMNITAATFKMNPYVQLGRNAKIIINGEEVENLTKYQTTDIPTDITLIESAQVDNFALVRELASVHGILIILAGVVGNMMATWILFKLFPQKSKKVIEKLTISKIEIINNLKYGFMGLIFILVFTVVNALIILGGFMTNGIILALFLPAMLLVGFIAMIILMVSKYYYVYKVGEVITLKIDKKLSNLFTNSLVGTILVTIFILFLSTVPIIGMFSMIITGIVLTVWGLGGTIRTLKK